MAAAGVAVRWAPAELKEDLQVALAAVASNPAATKPPGAAEGGRGANRGRASECNHRAQVWVSPGYHQN